MNSQGQYFSVFWKRKEVEIISDFCVFFFFSLQDKAQPETQAFAFGDVTFKATLAQDTPGGLPLVRQPGSDGFSLSSSPLFQVCVILKIQYINVLHRHIH